MPMVLMLVLKPLYVAGRLDSGTLQAVTGPLVMFSVFALSIVGNSILVEREWRTWDRLRATRAGRAELLLGKTGPVLVLLLLQQAVLLAFGCLVDRAAAPRPSTVGYAGPRGRHLGIRPCSRWAPPWPPWYAAAAN